MAQLPLIAPADRPGNVNFQKVYNRAKDKDVAVVILDVNGTTLCMDGQHALTAEEVYDCCEQGCIVQISGGFYRPVYWRENGGVAAVVCLGESETSDSFATKVVTSYQAP